MSFDMQQLVDALLRATGGTQLNIRQGRIESVEADGTVTVTIGGGTEPVAGVKVASSCCPIPGAGCWLTVGDRTAMVLATLAPVTPANLVLVRSSGQSIASGSFAAITWSTDAVDNAGMWTSGPTATVVVPGNYLFTADVTWPASVTGIRWLRLVLDGLASAEDVRAPVNTDQTITLAWTQMCSLGDTISLEVKQDTGSPVSISRASLAAVWLGP